MCNTECVLKGEGDQLGCEEEEALRKLHSGGRESAEVMAREGSWEKRVEKGVGV